MGFKPGGNGGRNLQAGNEIWDVAWKESGGEHTALL
jgi:hypothetical protein